MEAVTIIVCLLFSAFFSGMEIAYVSCNKVYLGVEKQQLSLRSRVLARLIDKPIQFLTAMMVGNSVALVIYAYNISNAITRWFVPEGSGIAAFYHLLIQVAISVMVLLFTAEFIPKVFFQIYANNLIKFFALPAYVFYWLFYQVSKYLIVVSDFILVKLLRTNGDKHQAFFSKGDLGNYITEQLSNKHHEEEVDSEIQIFRNALEFSGRKARDIMTPRTEIAAIDINEGIASLKDLFVETGYSKLVIYNEGIDDAIGYVHSFELFKKPKSIKQVLIPVEFVPETILIKDVLDLLTRKRKSMSVVLDEYGGTSGIITVEDIIEELFGEIEDEHDEEEELIEKELENGAYLFSARLDVAYLNEEYSLDLPESDSYATLGGLVVHQAGEIPQDGQRLETDGFVFVIQQASGKKIELIKVYPVTNK
ncbi:hemolysin family protein [Flavobacterium rhizosphaerae]|uniref:Hemolysin family protein n=1 Tax=Flavobacterium rhizosphaerae TaxID=3163298 RepID=A0ABW8YT03_9FLAO